MTILKIRGEMAIFHRGIIPHDYEGPMIAVFCDRVAGEKHCLLDETISKSA